jgi:hypothetical protein
MQVERVCFGGGFDLRLTVDGTYAEIRIAGPLTVNTGDESITFDLANAAWTDLAPLLGFAEKWIRRCEATEVGALEFEVDGVGAVHVPPQEGYEAWEVSADGAFVASLPGGEVTLVRDGRPVDL